MALASSPNLKALIYSGSLSKNPVSKSTFNFNLLFLIYIVYEKKWTK
jgi:hypothetical protein